MSDILPELAGGYYLERAPEVLVLRRVDGSLAAAFSSQGAAPEAIRWAAEEAGHAGAFAGDRKTPALAASPSLGLRANFFGRFELLRESQVVPLGRNGKALAILKCLLARRDCPVPRDYLMGWLWPESDFKRARWSLNSAVYALRGLLSGCLPSLSASETLLFEGGRYRLSPRIVFSTDTGDFDSRYEEGRRLEKAGRVSEAAAQFSEAVELYRGDYLTEDLYEEWTAIERQRLIDAYTDSLRRLAAYYMETGRPQEGVPTCYRVLEKDTCDEDAHCLLMEHFIRLGQRARALKQYRLCEGSLQQEYGMSPSPKTQALHATIRKMATAEGEVILGENLSTHRRFTPDSSGIHRPLL